MNDDQATRLLHRRADEIADTHVPVAEVIAAGSAAQRRSRRANALGGAVVVVLVGGLVVQQASTGGTDSTAERPSIAATESVPSASTPNQDGGPASAERQLDPLTFTLLLGTPRGDRLPSRLRVENNSGDTVTDPACLVFANYSFGVVRATQPGTTLKGRVETRCSGPQRIPNGYSETSKGPTFLLRGFPSGEYLATIDFGNARSDRLSEQFTFGSS